MMSTFETARLVELGSKTGYHTLTRLKMPSDMPAVSIPSQYYADITFCPGGVPSLKFSNFTMAYLFCHMYESNKTNLDDPLTYYGLHVENWTRDWHGFLNVAW